jgi:hypothetical protein
MYLSQERRLMTKPGFAIKYSGFGLICLVFGVASSLNGMPQEIPDPPGIEFAFEVRAQVADPTVVGQLPTGTRRIIDILGGTFEGSGIKGTLLPGGADWQMIQEDGFTDIDARYTLETDSGDLIYVSNIGIRHASPEVMRRLNAGETVDQSEIYFRAIPRFEVANPELEWLMRSIFIATGERYPNGVIIRFWRVL